MKIIVDDNDTFTVEQLANTLAEDRGWKSHSVKDENGDWEISYTDKDGVPHKMDCGFFAYTLNEKGEITGIDHDQDVDLTQFVKWSNIVPAKTEDGKTIFIHD